MTTAATIAKHPPDALFSLATDSWTAPFWNAAKEHRLVACQCADCGHFRMPPTPYCPSCRSQAVNWPELSGKGIIYSYSIVSYPIIPQMDDSIPYVPAIIELPEAGGVRLISNVVCVDVADIAVGQEVEVCWHDHSEEVSIPRFTLTNK